jgi:hypothetical protein
MSFGTIVARVVFASGAVTNVEAVDLPSRSSDPPPVPETRAANHRDRPGPYVALRANPLALLIGRKSVDLEVWPVSFLGITGGISGSDYKSAGGFATLTLTAVEGGVRYWSWLMPKSSSAGPFRVGLFVGPSVTRSWGNLLNSSTSLTQWTGAVEGGFALFLRPLILGAGGGLQYTNSSYEPHGCQGGVCVDADRTYVDTMQLYYGDGFRPRVLLSAGFAL